MGDLKIEGLLELHAARVCNTALTLKDPVGS